ncbi:MBL fold metallo-hydrolase, partial [bacterium]|nr:MBL fold metallo-hydrolase [bacterium]
MSAIRITFLGAAGTVTGSKYLIEYEKKKLLVDCGLFQGHKDLRLRNWRKLPVTPSEIDAVILTHAHIDHTGYLPRLVKDGFKGPIYGTPATIEFTKILLLDSAHLQEEDAAYFNKLGTSKHKPALPLYDEQDAQKVLPLLKAYPPIENFQVLPGWNLRQVVAGHILGAMSLLLEVGGRLLTFSGDIGRYGVPILQDPGAVEIG